MPVAWGSVFFSLFSAKICWDEALQNAAKEVGEATGGTLDVLINNGAYISQERADFTIDT